MNERLLQYIWQHQQFNSRELYSLEGDRLEVIDPGILNRNQGPDFSQARIRIGSTIFAGSVELHIRSSDWFKHHHHQDNNYGNVILHVVWENDLAGQLLQLPQLELKGRVALSLLSTYHRWMETPSFIPCDTQIVQVENPVWEQWQNKLLQKRLARKSLDLLQKRHQPDAHWDELYWQLLAHYFGGKVNGAAFEDMARRLPLRVIERHFHQIHQLESLLLGQCGLLKSPFTESYPEMLRKEYQWLQKKHHLPPPVLPVYFLRMRPGNFPSVRLAQLAMLLHQQQSLFRDLTAATDCQTYRQSFCVTANDYWNTHYRLGEESAFLPKQTGQQFIDSLLINVACPTLFAYGEETNDPSLSGKALEWLRSLSPESNSVINGFIQTGIPVHSAADSQALLEMKTQYCDLRKCLECSVGAWLLNRNPETAVSSRLSS